MNEFIFLSGMMGTGKSTVSAELSRTTGLPLVDLDLEISRSEGRSIEAIFATDGEACFRDIESTALDALLGGPASVVALGGGTVVRRSNRERLLSSGTLITLVASDQQLVRRTQKDTEQLGVEARPLLADADKRLSTLRALKDARSAQYAECHQCVDTEHKTPAQIAAEILDVIREAPILVPLGIRSYRVWVGVGARARWTRCLSEAGIERALIVSDDRVFPLWKHALNPRPGAVACELSSVVLPEGEENKNLVQIEKIWQAALDGNLDRSSAIVGFGGGVVGDMAGFGAATYLRGVNFAQVPTSLLAMVDASVGGKTGFDRPEGKNLIGAFHQPKFVVCDIELLSTLAAEELTSGLAEVVKAAWIDSEEAVASLEEDAEALAAADPKALERAIRMAITLKARIVAQDEREGGCRRWLNLGHTIGHGIESAAGLGNMRHGECVALGMVAAFRVAHCLGDPRASAHEQRLERLLLRLNLPTGFEEHLRPEVFDFVGRDKKRDGALVGFVVPGAPGQISVVPLGVDQIEEAVRAPVASRALYR